MKRIISVLLSLIIITACSVGYAEEMGAEFTLTAIDNSKDAKWLNMSITLPRAVDGGTLIIAFYTEGVCTKVITKDASSATSFRLINEEYSVTPDTIKLMLWEKDKIKPLFSAQNGLTAEVCQTANKKVLELLDNLLPTTGAIRKLLNTYTNDDKAIEEMVKAEITKLLDAIDTCEAKAKDNGYGQNELLTAEYCKREFAQELIEIQGLYSNASDVSKNLLNNYYTSHLDTIFNTEKYSATIRAFMGFFNIKIF